MKILWCNDIFSFIVFLRSKGKNRLRKGEFPLAQSVENVHKDFFFRHCCFSYISFLKCKQKYFLRAIELQNVSNDNTSMCVIVSLKLIFLYANAHTIIFLLLVSHATKFSCIQEKDENCIKVHKKGIWLWQETFKV